MKSPWTARPKQYSVSAQSVQEALQKCGVELSEEDRLNCKPKDKIKDGMQIVVQRVTTEEAVEKEEIPYETAYEDTDSLYEGETSVKSAGEKGEKEVKYKLVYVDGKLDGKEVLEEKVIKEPVKEVVLRGTLVQETPAPDYSGGSSSGGVGTFVDYNGNVVSYSGLLTGDCTAYSVAWRNHFIGLGCRLRRNCRGPQYHPLRHQAPMSPRRTAASYTATEWREIPAEPVWRETLSLTSAIIPLKSAVSSADA